MRKTTVIIFLAAFMLSSVPAHGQETNVNQIMRLHRQAIGGIDALIGMATARLTWDYSVDGKAAGILEAWHGSDGYYRSILSSDQRWSSISFDGSAAYRINPSTRFGRSPHTANGSGFDPYFYYSTLVEADLFPLMAAEGRGAELSLIPASRGAAFTLRARYPSGAERIFDLDGGKVIIRDRLIVQREAFTLEIVREPSAYRRAGGGIQPGIIEIRIDGTVTVGGQVQRLNQRRTMRLREAEADVQIAPDFFKPGFPAIVPTGSHRTLGDLVFRFAGETPVGDDPESILLADMNGDGFNDLLTGDDGGVSLLTGDGNGAFPLRLELNGGGGSNEYALPADLNDDGLMDVAIASTASPEATLILLIADSPASFTTVYQVETGDFPEAIVAADFNQDGHLDLAAAHNRSGDARVHFGSSSGAMTSSIVLPLEGRGENLVTADFNGDGTPDLAVVDQRSLYIFLNLGDGSFQEPVVLPAGPLPFCLGAADITGDGITDVIVGNGGIFADAGDEDIALLVGRGDGNFQPAVFISAGASISSLWPADLDADGDIDIALASFGTHEAFLLLNNNGSLVNVGSLPCNWSPSAIVCGDLDGNGTPDIAVANEFGDTISIWLLEKQ